MTLEELGYNDDLEKFRISSNLQSFDIGRVVAEHKERYIVKTPNGDYDAEITGNMRFTATSRENVPAVGDFVTISAFDSSLAIIHGIFPRFSAIKRQAVGQFGDVQIIATNVDYAFLLQAVGRDFSINRLERYLTICNASKVKPIIVLTKIDLIDEQALNEVISKIQSRISGIPVLAISNVTKSGYQSIIKEIEWGKTYCLLGSSGVGKSTLINMLAGRSVMKTDSVSQSTNRGKHVTSHRELIILENGGMLIDNPGMREVGIADSAKGIEATFDIIEKFSRSCKYKDCTHTQEIGCMVLVALASGEIDNESYENYLKLVREKAHFEASVFEKKKKEKNFGKILKTYKKDMKKNMD